jgi:hypothetical protein
MEQEQETLFDTKSLDDVVNEAAEKKAEELNQTEQKSEETTEKVEKPEEKPGEVKDDKAGEKKTDTTGESAPPKEEDVFEKFPEAKQWKDRYDNYDQWEKMLRQRAQAIAYIEKLPDEQKEIVFNKLLPFAYGKEELPKTPTELVDDVMKNISLEDFKFEDEDGLEVSVTKDRILPQVKKAVELTLNSAVPEMAAIRKELFDTKAELKKAQENGLVSQTRLGEVELENLVSKHEGINLTRVKNENGETESILEAVNRIGSVDNHPERGKLLKLQAIGQLADRMGWKPDRAYEELFGTEERLTKEKKRTEETIAKNQQEATQETPSGESKKLEEDWEKPLSDISRRQREVEKMMKL